jgi:hypothetical protein
VRCRNRLLRGIRGTVVGNGWVGEWEKERTQTHLLILSGHSVVAEGIDEEERDERAEDC